MSWIKQAYKQNGGTYCCHKSFCYHGNRCNKSNLNTFIFNNTVVYSSLFTTFFYLPYLYPNYAFFCLCFHRMWVKLCSKEGLNIILFKKWIKYFLFWSMYQRNIDRKKWSKRVPFNLSCVMRAIFGRFELDTFPKMIYQLLRQKL